MKIRENRFRINSEMKKILFHWYIYIALSMIDTKNLQLRSYHDIKSIDMKLKHYLAFLLFLRILHWVEINENFKRFNGNVGENCEAIKTVLKAHFFFLFFLLH